MTDSHPVTSRLRILDSAKRLTQARGFAATTVDAICEESGLTKGSFFHHFRSKEDLGLAMLEHFWRELQRRTGSAPYRGESDPLARLRQFLDFNSEIYREPALREGCLLAIFTQETPAADAPLRMACAGYFAEWLEGVTAEMRLVTAGVSLPADVTAEQLARCFVSLLQGSLILAKATGNADIVSDNLQQFGQYLRSLASSAAAGKQSAAKRRR